MAPDRRRNSEHARWRIGVLLVALGIGAAIAGGAGVAHADEAAGAPSTSASSTESRPDTSTPDTPTVARSTAGDDEDAPKPGSRRHTTAAESRESDESEESEPAAVRRSAPRTARTAPLTATRPEAPAAVVTVQPEPEPAVAPTVPSPTDAASTPYGDIGKWMLTWGDRIANWGGKKYQGRTLFEAVNVIIVDPNSTSTAQAADRLNKAMFRSGFPAQPLHSFGFRGRIDDVTYGQRPKGLLLSYSNDFFLRPNDHGRIFGPDPVQTDTGFVWSAAFSTEKVGFTGWLPGHVYVSSNRARDSLATALVNSGQATFGGMVPLDNAYNTATTTTGDHDGFAVVLVLTGIGGPPRREMLVSLPGEVASGLTSASSPARTCPAFPATAVSLQCPTRSDHTESVTSRSRTY
ncbi:hypothetical protein [Mycobacterium sp. C31M]